MKPVAVLGAGPAGLLAAHMVGLSGRPVAVLSTPGQSGQPEPSRLGGAQFLHEPVPHVNDITPDAVITYRLEGDPDGYAQKVYGGWSGVPFVSMSNISNGTEQNAWNLIKTYGILWEMLEPCIQPQEVDAEYVQEALDKCWFDRIISSVPAPAICADPRHSFASTESRIANKCILQDLPDNTVMYSGDKDRSWHRSSRLFGVGGTEWPQGGSRLPLPTVTARKPLKTNCRCWQGQVLRVGRFGTWTKGVLVNDSMHIVKEALSG